jgi:alanine dehydrogenase
MRIGVPKEIKVHEYRVALGLNICAGKISFPAVAIAHGYEI